MQNVSIQKIHDSDAGASSLIAEMEKTVESIRQRAYDYFLQRGGFIGNDLEDWLRAERELVSAPRAEISENEKDVTLDVQAPGLTSDDIQVTATPHSILVQSGVTHKHEEKNGNICLCEFSEKLFRRFDLPARINVEKVTAKLENGMLRIVAAKSEQADNSRSIPVAAAASARS